MRIQELSIRDYLALALMICLIVTISAAAPVKVGDAYIQTERPANCQWNGTACACSWALNPTPIFGEYAPVTDAMKDGPLVKGLHSWAGFMVWPNNTLTAVKPIKNVSPNGLVVSYWEPQDMPFLQQPIYADPLILLFRPVKYSNIMNYGDVSGLVFSMPIPVALQGAKYMDNNCTGGTFSVDDKTFAVDQGGAFASGLRVFPAANVTATGPSWVPDNLVTDRMGDWDVHFLYQHTGSAEYLGLELPKGSPFAQFTWHDAPPGGVMAFKFYREAPFTSTMQRYNITTSDITAPVSGVDNLGCYLVGTNQDLILESTDKPGTYTNWNFFAVYYDIRKYQVTEDPGNGIALTRIANTTGEDTFVIAGLPVISYPKGQGSGDPAIPTREQALSESSAWAVALAPYAFNYVTGTEVSYSVDHATGLLHTTYHAATATQGPVGASAGKKTVMLLQRHQYGTFEDGRDNVSVFDGDLGAVSLYPLAPGIWNQSMPAVNNGHYQYWIPKGKLVPITAESFSTSYVFNNFLPFMPPVDANATKDGEFLWHIINCDQSDYTQKNAGAYPPFWTYIDGGQQDANYNMAKEIRYVSGKLAVTKELSRVANQSRVITGETAWDYEHWALSNASWNGTDYYATSRDHPYDPTLAHQRDLEAVEEFFRLYTMQTPFRSSRQTDGSAWQYSPYYFLYDRTLGAIFMYPAQGPDKAGQQGGPADQIAYGYFPMPTRSELYGGARCGFGNAAEWNDDHYLYGDLIASAAMTGWFDREWAAPEHYGSLIDQMIMSIAYDPGVTTFYRNPELRYSKMNFFDQWAGQSWTQGQIDGYWQLEGKNDNTLGETMQAWAGIALWGSVTDRPQVTDLGIYLYTTNLYNADAYWFDKTGSYIPDYRATAAVWSKDGDYIPVTSDPLDPRSHNSGESMWDRWFNWGNPKITWPSEQGAQKTSMVPKVYQMKVSNFGQFGLTPSSNMFNMWLPMTPYSLGFGRDKDYMQYFTRTVDYSPSSGYCQSTDPGGLAYRTTENQQRALVGVTTSVPGISKEPYDWFWEDLIQKNRQGESASYPYNLDWWNPIKSSVFDSQSISESLDYFWALDQYGTPDFRYFGYSADADTAGLTQPYTAAFTDSYGHTTFVAWNQHAKAVTVNWWNVGSSAKGTSGILQNALQVPPGWYATITVPERDTPIVCSVSVTPGNVTPGQSANLTVRVKNTGTTRISGVRVTQYLPSRVSVVSGDPGMVTQAGSVYWPLSGLSPNEERTFNLTERFAVTANGQVAQIAFVNGTLPTGEPVEYSNYTVVTAEGGPGIGLAVLAEPTNIAVGRNTTFNLTVTNTGTELLQNVYVIQHLSQYLVFEETIPTVNKSDFKDGVLTLNFNRTLAPGDAIPVQVIARAVTAGNVTVETEAHGALPAGTVNASANTTLLITGQGPAIDVDLDSDSVSAVAGGPLKMRITVTNTGSMTWDTVTVQYYLQPPGPYVIPGQGTAPLWNETPAPNIYMWDYDPGHRPGWKGLSAGENLTIVLATTVTANATGDLSNYVQVNGAAAGGKVGQDNATLVIPVVHGGTSPDFTASPREGTSPVTVQFTDTSTGNPVKWLWNFGDGSIPSTVQNPVHTYTRTGQWDVTLTVYRDNASVGVNLTKKDYISVKNAPQPGLPDAQFSASPRDGSAPLEVQFTDLSTGGPDSWSWTFGDGGLSSLQNPKYNYKRPGTYSVVLTVKNSGGSDKEVKSGYITVGVAPGPGVPHADFSANTTSGTIPFTVRFTDASTGNPTRWIWTFGDGGYSSEHNPVHTYTRPGEFDVKLIASNGKGSNGKTVVDYIVVREAPGPGVPDANFSVNVTNGTLPFTVNFTDLSTGDPTSWIWNFGDASIPSAERNVTHTYTRPGAFDVTLSVANAAGRDNQTVTDCIVVTG